MRITKNHFASSVLFRVSSERGFMSKEHPERIGWMAA